MVDMAKADALNVLGENRQALQLVERVHLFDSNVWYKPTGVEVPAR